ncbi:MAG: 4-(cytidine 5'-diphospho)-2-C-methyl-D-erythritol kinase [Clostridiales bacterium]|nr:4-(cytidine 5'-diphospho)-2-C-methyl-D-erythritol kinase [Clostridiales bacterium]
MLCLEARAKINWTLDITGRREDGYHLMDMLMQSVSLHDTLWLEEDELLSLHSAGGNVVSEAGSRRESAAPVPFDEKNLVIKAARALQKYTGKAYGAKITLQKGIPSGAGMGGGSADAAAALVGLNSLWQLGLTLDELKKIGLTLGADVPFMLTGGLARVSGIGEIIRPIDNPPEIWLTLWQPCDGLSTGEIFFGFDSTPPGKVLHPRNSQAEQALCQRDLSRLCAAMENVLQPVSVEKRPEIARSIQQLKANPGCHGAMMTGSGSVVYGVFDTQADAVAALDTLRAEKGFTAVTHSAAQGILQV